MATPTAEAHAPTHVEHTGHGAHHVLAMSTLMKVFAALCVLTVVTVVAALGERALHERGVLFFEPFSVPFALAIAGAKATIVAMYFMGLKYDSGTNRVAFAASIVFLLIFVTFTYFDTGFRGQFEDASAVPVDVIRADEEALALRDSIIQVRIAPPSLVNAPDTLLLPQAQTDPTATSRSAPVVGGASSGPATPEARGANAAAPSAPIQEGAPAN